MFVVKVLIEGRAKTCFCHSCGLFFVCVCHTLSCRIVSKSIFMIKIGFHVDLGDVSQHFSRIPKMLHLSRQAQVMDFRKFQGSTSFWNTLYQVGFPLPLGTNKQVIPSFKPNSLASQGIILHTQILQLAGGFKCILFSPRFLGK